MIFLSALLFLLTFFCVHSYAEESADAQAKEEQEKLEKADDDINKHIVESETGIYYTVQEGDTLWDLSQQFSDSPYVWPDLWKENKQISNPHLIYPGEKIRLFRKSDLDRFKEKAEKEEPAYELSELIKPEPEEKPFYLYSSIDSIGFIKKKPIKHSGYLFKVRENKGMIGFGDQVYVRPQGDTVFTPGEKYTLYRTIERIKGASTKKYPGVQYYLTGVIEILHNEPDFAEAEVVQSFRTIRVDDLLMPYERRSKKVYFTESKKDLTGKIIVSEEGTEYFGEDFIAFIDKGSKDGVERGQFYTVYYQNKERIDNSGFFSFTKKTKLTPVDFAEILVLHAEENTATVLITQSDISVYPDASFRAVEK